MSIWKKAGPGAVILFYLLIGLEVIIMITPFTVYFYSLYAPVLNRLEASPWTSWLTAFFLPHITASDNGLLTLLAYLGPILFALGLLIFFVCAAQVYSAKLFRRGVVTKGLYAHVRHPQYLGLGIAGLGLLLYWPRFFILAAYITMLFVYYLLARNEEGRMERKFGQSYRLYKEKIPAMFLPGNPGKVLFSLFPGAERNRGLALAGLYVLVLISGVAAAFALREHTKASVPIYSDGQGMVAISMSPSNPEALKQVMAVATQDGEVRRLLSKFHQDPNHTLIAYVLPTEYMMQHLIVDLGEHEAHHGEGEKSGMGAVLAHLGEMYTLKPLRQLWAGKHSNEKRVIFTEALTARGNNVPVEEGFGVSVLRYPLFFADLNLVQEKVSMTIETPRRHAWGTVPVPAF